MTQDEIEAEQELMRAQAAQEKKFSAALPTLSEEEGDDVTPFDLFNPSAYTSREIRDARYATCKGCDRLTALTKQCKECACVMPMKTWLDKATCPLGKW